LLLLLLFESNVDQNRSKRSNGQKWAKILKRPFGTVLLSKEHAKLQPVLNKWATFLAVHVFIPFEKSLQ
jgi:hypothetical protein